MQKNILTSVFYTITILFILHLQGCLTTPIALNLANNTAQSLMNNTGQRGHLVHVSFGLNVRKGPSMQNKVLGCLRPADNFWVKKKKGNWYFITKEGSKLEGWAYSKYIQVDNNVPTQQGKQIVSSIGKNHDGKSGNIIASMFDYDKTWESFKSIMDNDLLQTVANNDELQGDIQDMKNRTRLEGTAVGALTGFVIGSFSDDTNVKVASSLIGAATGLIAGEYVAHKKAEYANEEAYLDACIDEAERYNQVARESNKNLRKQICRKEKIIESLQHQIANGVECQKHIEEEFEDTKEKQKAVDEIIQGLESELIAQQKAINTISDADLRQVNKLQAEMEVTKSELRELKSQRQQLTNIMFEMSEMTV